ncbi:hypothetical protein RJT34_22998 [Clitoria ternatea]|uniref:Uncharacterized protein n=1 Tax=Clitoria ternatea TaxID=43366 RepID=A0AAN9FK46_CLITE
MGPSGRVSRIFTRFELLVSNPLLSLPRKRKTLYIQRIEDSETKSLSSLLSPLSLPSPLLFLSAAFQTLEILELRAFYNPQEALNFLRILRVCEKGFGVKEFVWFISEFCVVGEIVVLCCFCPFFLIVFLVVLERSGFRD